MSSTSELFAVVPVLTGPLQLLLALLPAILAALGGLLLSLLRPRAMLTGLKLLWRLKIPLCVATALVVGLFAVRSRLASSSTSGMSLPLPDAATSWPIARGSLARTGALADSDGPTQGGIVWSFERNGAAVFSSPAIVGDRIYFTSAQTSLFNSGGSGEIHCLDAQSGKEVWSFTPPGFRATFSSPVVDGDYLVCGEGLHLVRDARVICVNLREGRLAWEYRTNSHVECTPVIHEGRVYVGAGDDGYYCFKLEPDSRDQAQVVWHAPGEKYIDAETSLAVWKNANGRSFVFAGLGVGGKALCVLDAENGEELHRIPADYPIFSPPAIVEGKLYVGMGNGDYVHPAEELNQPRGGAVWCLDISDLAQPPPVLWRYATDDTVLGAVAMDNHVACFASRDGRLHVVNSVSGETVTTWNARAPIVTAPAVTNDAIYLLTNDGMMYGLSRAGHNPVWQCQVSTGPLLISSPVVAHGHVYVGTEHEGLICAGMPGTQAAPLWPSALGGPGIGGNPHDEALPARGAFAWQYPGDQMGTTQEALVTAPIAPLGDRLYVPLTGEELRGVAELDVSKPGEEAPSALLHRTVNPVVTSPAAAGRWVLLADGKPGDAGRNLRVSKDGDWVWKAPIEPDASGVLAMDRDHVVIQDYVRSLACYQLDVMGDRWRREVGQLDHPPAIHNQLLIVAVTDPPAIMAADLPTGEILWETKLSGFPTTSPVVAGDIILLGTSEWLEAFRLVDGRPQPDWSHNLPPVASELVVRKQWIAYVDADGNLIIADRSSGKLRRRQTGALAGITPTTSRDQLIYAGPTALWQISPLTDAPPTVWMETDWLGAPTSSPVVHNGRLYMGRRGWGLVCFGAAP